MMSGFFSESWHRIAKLQISLVTSVRIHKQRYRGQSWYILRDMFSDRFFRIRPEAYRFIIRLDANKTVQELWEQQILEYPDTSPGQDEVLHLLSQLHNSNLLYFKNSPDSRRIFDRYEKGKKRERQSKLLSLLSARIPLWDPDKWLNKALPFIKLLLNPVSGIIWLVVLIIAASAVASHASELKSQAQGMLAPSNLIWLYFSTAFLKFFHEMGHAMVCKRYGGHVHNMGITFLILTPQPYVDATASWGFRNRWHRAFVGAAGMVVELFFAAIAAIIWTNSGQGLINSLSFNVMMIGSISSLVFNGNPLIRFDSYYILSDLLEIPNLYQKAQQQWYYWFQKYAFGCEDLISPAYSESEAFWLGAYGLSSFGFRVLVAVGIIFFAADQWLLLGIIMGITAIYIWLLRPLFTFVSYLINSQQLYRTRHRAVLVSIAIFSSLILTLFIIPFPCNIEAPGIVEAKDFKPVYALSSGYLNTIVVENSQAIKQGDLIAEFSNPELQLEIKATEAQLKETDALLMQARDAAIADVKPIEERMNSLKKNLAELVSNQQHLQLNAEISGIWVAPPLKPKQHTWFRRGEKVGVIVPAGDYRFTAVVSQEKAYDLFDGEILDGKVKLHAATDQNIQARDIKIIPYERRELPSAALSWVGGGDIALAKDQMDGKHAAESFFEVRAQLKKLANFEFLHGYSGVLRLKRPSQPLFEQFMRKLYQTLQKRYQL
jgi:putative peptide zinc metalloprotease protein